MELIITGIVIYFVIAIVAGILGAIFGHSPGTWK